MRIRPGAGWDGAVSRLTALVPGPVCAAALGRDWPDDLNGQVRCIDEGSRGLGLASCCAPGPDVAQDPASVTAGLVATPAALPVLGVVRGPLSSELLSEIHRRGGEHAGSSPIQDVQGLLDPAALQRHCQASLPDFCQPRYLEILEELPKTATHEVNKPQLRHTGGPAVLDLTRSG